MSKRNQDSDKAEYTQLELAGALNSAAEIAMRTSQMNKTSSSRQRVLRDHVWQLSQILQQHAKDHNLTGEELTSILATTTLMTFVLRSAPSVKHVSVTHFQKVAQAMVDDTIEPVEETESDTILCVNCNLPGKGKKCSRCGGKMA